MDNLETGVSSDPQEAADVTAASGQSDENIETQATEESASTDVATETPVETKNTHPWATDERFKDKTPEQMYEIVQEADRYKGALSQKAKVADALSQQFGLTPERMAEIVQERAEAARRKQIESNPVGAVYDELQQVKQQLAERDQQAEIREADMELDKYLTENPSFAQFREQGRKLGFTVDRDKTWDQIFNSYFGQAIVAGQENAYNKIDIKQKTQATGVSRGEVKTSLTTEDLQKMTVAELKAVLPKANRP